MDFLTNFKSNTSNLADKAQSSFNDDKTKTETSFDNAKGSSGQGTDSQGGFFKSLKDKSSSLSDKAQSSFQNQNKPDNKDPNHQSFFQKHQDDVKNPFASDAEPLNGVDKQKKGDKKLYENDDDSTLLKNKHKTTQLNENQIISSQTVLYIVEFIFIAIICLTIIPIGSFLINNYDKDTSKEGYEAFPIGENFIDRSDLYNALSDTVSKSMPRYKEDKAANNDDPKKYKKVQSEDSTIFEPFFSITNVFKKKTKEFVDSNSIPDKENDEKILKAKNPLIFYWIFSAITFTQLIFNKMVVLWGQFLNYTSGKEDSEQKDNLFIKFFKNIGRNFIVLLLMFFFILLIPIIVIIFISLASWELCWTLYIFSYEGVIRYITRSIDKCEYPISKFFKILFLSPLYIICILAVIVPNLLLKFLGSTVWSVFYLVGQIYVFWKIGKSVYSGIKRSSSGSEKITKTTNWRNSVFRVAVIILIGAAYSGFNSIFQLDSASATNTIITTISILSIILINLY